MTFFTFHGLPTQDLNYDFVYKYSSKNILCKYFERQMYWHYFHVLNLYTLILKFQNFDRTDRRSTFVDRWSVYFLLGSLVLAVQIKKKKKSFRATCKLSGCFFCRRREEKGTCSTGSHGFVLELGSRLTNKLFLSFCHHVEFGQLLYVLQKLGE